MFKVKPKYFYKKNFVSKSLFLLSFLYLLGFYLSHLLKKLSFKSKKRLGKHVICIGNIVCGGSGKTPVCIEIGKYLNTHGLDGCFITKGYNRKSKEETNIPKDHHQLFSADQVGDEALLLSNEADVFVVNKRAQSQCIDGKYDFVILDDGLFDSSIIKDVNVVVFDSNFFIGNGYVLPAGPLRTRFKTLAKADFVILTDVKDDGTARNQINMLSVYIDPSKILQAKLKVKSLHSKTEKYIAFSGIGENQKFFDTLKREGLNVVCEVEFEDHVWYDQKNLDILATKFKELQATKFITTSKDYVKLPEEFHENVEVLKIEYEIPGLDAIFKTS
ncbi:MAG: tetraacyldisaccharide 4'-kinase [Rickettsiales bacterium]|nr:tetraacyldisaccharide 4'-kinase [Rickettsiales bacterium]